ncbi:autotransporter domain-containing protein [Mesorhizobium sp. BH1-1-4]|uniref:autotransporter domain-containing protein n=1 Tax=Mesorhizobium sp. BH1-1-4 TaxID=2876662 RepID=UPI001CD120C2|nr:autotransporter domain-containing protein [Mesorhizobium sp. BH1-1-4]MBZ9993129.1 autotransporter domain-containing protein [Mesorhizobium sp. BH1-1-4]
MFATTPDANASKKIYSASRFLVVMLGSTALVGVGLSAPAVAGSPAWTGSASTDWFNDGNWTPGSAPTTGDMVTIDAVSPNPTVVDGGSTADLGGLDVGGAATGALRVQLGGVVNVSGNARVGVAVGSNGNMTINGITARMTVGDFTLGVSGVGTLNIFNGGLLTSSDAMLGAFDGGAANVATVFGAGSKWNLGAHNLVVGNDGVAEVDALQGGAVVVGSVSIGEAAAGSGTAKVDGGASAISSSGTLSIGDYGKGLLVLSNDGSATAAQGTYIAAFAGSTGTLNIGGDAASAAAAPGALETPTVTFGAGTGTINFNHTSSDYTFAAGMTGYGKLNQYAGTTHLMGDSSGFTGPTNIYGGTLLIDGTFGSNVSTLPNGGLGGKGVIAGAVTIANAGALIGVQGQTLTMDSLSLSGNSIISATLGAPDSDPLFSVAHDLTLDGRLFIEAAPGFGNGVYRLANYGGMLTDNGVTIVATPSGTTAADFAIQTAVSGQVNLINDNVPAGSFSFWDGAGHANNSAIDGGDGIWSATVPNWTDATGATDSAMLPQPGLAIFEAAPGTVTVDDGAGNVTVTGMQFASDGYHVVGGAITLADPDTAVRVGDGTLAGAAYVATIDAPLAGTGGLEKTDLGKAVLGGINTYTGATTITNGTLALSGDGSIAASSGVKDNATFDISATSAGTSIRSLSGDGSVQLGSRTLTLTAAQDNFGGVISGIGGLAVTGGFEILNGANIYTGGTTISTNAGVIIGNTSTTQGSIKGDVADNGVLGFDQSDALTFGGVISGSGAVEENGSGSVTLSAVNTYIGGTYIGSGTMIGSASSFGSGAITANGALVIDQTSSAILANVINGTGTFAKRGTGSLDLSGTGSFSGITTIEAGELAVNGSFVNSAVVAESGTRLSGTGTVGALVAQTGSIVAPGNNSIGTLNDHAYASFDHGSVYQVEVNAAGQSDKIIAGAAFIAGGTIQVLAGTGNYAPSTQYTILTATYSGVSGVFDDVTSNLAFLSPELSYDADNVYLKLTRNGMTFQNVGQTRNQIAAGGGVESLGDASPIYDAVLQLDAPSSRAAFDGLSGEIHASVKTPMIEDSHFVRDAATNRIRAAFGGVGAQTNLDNQSIVASIPGDTRARTINPDRGALWSQAFGSWGLTDSDGNAANLNRSIGGVFVGGDVPVFDDWRIGAIAGYSHSSFDAKGRGSAGSSDNYDFGLYGGTQWGAFGLRVGAAYTWHAVDTGRSVAFPGFADSLSGKYDAGTAQVFGDLGYRIDAGSFSFEPFAGLAYVNLRTDDFSEEGGAAALSAGNQSTAVTFSTLGLRASEKIDLGGVTLTARGTLGWRHAGQATPVSTLTMAGGNPFTVAGVPIARDCLLIDAGLDMALSRTITLGLSYSGQIASHARDHGFNANLNWKF